MHNPSKNWKEFLLKKERIKANIQKELQETHLVSLGDQETILNNNIENYFKVAEERGRSRQRGIYRFYCMLSYKIDTGDRQRGLDDILADIRALPNVTIVSVVVSNERIAPQSYVAGLSIKFIPSTPGTFNDPEDVKKKIILGIKNTGNVQRVFRVSFKLERLE